MELEKIEGLVKILEASSLKAMTIKEGDFMITMSKPDNLMMSSSGSTVSAPSEAVVLAAKEENEVNITSPIVGTFYSAPGPESPAYVKVGDHVKTGETVCILEAMKMLNEITAEFDCEIEAVLVSNEQKVEYGQPLFRVKKL